MSSRLDKVSSLICAGELNTCPVVPREQTRPELLATTARVHPVPGQGEVLTDRTKAREERLRAPGIAEALHLTLTPACGLVAVFRAVVDPGRSLHEDVFRASQLRHFRLRRRIA